MGVQQKLKLVRRSQRESIANFLTDLPVYQINCAFKIKRTGRELREMIASGQLQSEGQDHAGIDPNLDYEIAVKEWRWLDHALTLDRVIKAHGFDVAFEKYAEYLADIESKCNTNPEKHRRATKAEHDEFLAERERLRAAESGTSGGKLVKLNGNNA